MNTEKLLFALVQSVICGRQPDAAVQAACTQENLSSVYTLAAKYDIAHLVGQALSKLPVPECEALRKCKQTVMPAFVRSARLEQDYARICKCLEEGEISFLPLKGAILRNYYPESWMRTSCDVDILVHQETLEKAVALLKQALSYQEIDRTTHDVIFTTPSGSHIELHFDLVEEGRANLANDVLQNVWENAALQENCSYRYEMTDSFFYFYHIAHMAKHIETGGCGIRPLIDLWLLDNVVPGDWESRDALLEKGKLLPFAQAARKLSRVWLSNEKADDLSLRLQDFLLHGGIYGSSDSRVAVQQKKNGGKVGYVFSRVFAPYSKLKGYYPILEKHPWLMPVMQVRRWFMIFRPDVAQMAKNELAANAKLETSRADAMLQLMNDLGMNDAND